MRELDTILAQYNSLKSAGTSSVLATVVHVQGSSYRGAGARMLVDEFGNITGAISGGCLEGDALRKALLAMHQQQNKLVSYDTSDEQDAIIGAQLGCNGIIQVLFEHLDYDDPQNPCELLKSVVAENKQQAIVIFFDLNPLNDQLGTSFLVDSDCNLFGTIPKTDLREVVMQEVQRSLHNNQNHFAEISSEGRTYHLFIQKYQSPITLIIVGAGNDAQILTQQAQMLGWNVVVTDGRPTHANHQRFSSCQVIVSKPEQTFENIEIDDRSCIVLMSHNYNYDFAVLRLLIDEKQVPYIGILGPKKKYERMLENLRMKGHIISDELLKKIHAPVGLDIGAETPAEIGLSILAEIQSVLNERNARPLKERLKPIHDKADNKFKEIHI